MNIDSQKRWIALFILCLGDLMIVLDTTIVNVALPSIQSDLAFTQTSLVWVVNAYMLTFSGFLLLGGRLGDLFGQRKIFLVGLVMFTLASLACGMAHTQTLLIISRAVQGIGGAIVSAVALSLIINLFTEPNERAKAMGFFGFVAAGGGAVGVFLGGLLTGSLNWHWVFLVNIPIGIAVYILCIMLLPKSEGQGVVQHLDIAGAVTVTASLMLAVYAIVGGNGVGWFTWQTIGSLVIAILLFGIFLYIETRARVPLVPLSIFSMWNVSTASIIGILWSAAMFSWFFLSALYLQLVLGYDPLAVGLSFLPADLIMAAFSLGLSAKIVMRFGTSKPLALGMFLVAIGLVLFAFAPAHGSFLFNVLPSMTLLGIGAGLAFNPILLAAMDNVPENESGLASGVLNTAFMMGGSLGLAILAAFATLRTERILAHGGDQITALLSGYHVAFLVGTVFALAASALSLFVLREISQDPAKVTLSH
jgi:EmrB/QacA subfamily drug resistance transporter